MSNNFKISELMPDIGKKLLSSKGKDFILNIGVETVKEVLFELFCGKNLREATEFLTRKRIAISNGALFILFIKGCMNNPDFIDSLIQQAAQELEETTNKYDRWVLQWILGLTDKAMQNILRDDTSNLYAYCNEYDKILNEVSRFYKNEYGEIKSQVRISNNLCARTSWDFYIKLFEAMGSQTLTLRGSEKSIYGKLFEKLVLGSLLHILGFRQINPEKQKSFNKVFWLSSQGDKRESDATAIFKAGKGIRFDIGFIGRGNPEITLDKVTRFEKEMQFGNSKHYMATFIIVDRISKESRIVDLAKRVDGTIIQMSMSFWPREVARILNEVLGTKYEIAEMPDDDIFDYLKEKFENLPIDRFIS